MPNHSLYVFVHDTTPPKHHHGPSEMRDEHGRVKIFFKQERGQIACYGKDGVWHDLSGNLSFQKLAVACFEPTENVLFDSRPVWSEGAAMRLAEKLENKRFDSQKQDLVNWFVSHDFIIDEEKRLQEEIVALVEDLVQSAIADYPERREKTAAGPLPGETVKAVLDDALQRVTAGKYVAQQQAILDAYQSAQNAFQEWVKRQLEKKPHRHEAALKEIDRLLTRQIQKIDELRSSREEAKALREILYQFTELEETVNPIQDQAVRARFWRYHVGGFLLATMAILLLSAAVVFFPITGLVGGLLLADREKRVALRAAVSGTKDVLKRGLFSIELEEQQQALKNSITPKRQP